MVEVTVIVILKMQLNFWIMVIDLKWPILLSKVTFKSHLQLLVYNVVNDFDEGDDLTVLKNQGMGLRTEILLSTYSGLTATRSS